MNKRLSMLIITVVSGFGSGLVGTAIVPRSVNGMILGIGLWLLVGLPLTTIVENTMKDE